MKAIEVKNGIYWVGAIDWNIRNFHGYLTDRGSSYGAYLIIDEKVALIDTVKACFAHEMLERIQDIVPLDKIDLVISNHVEMDHSGALPVIMSKCKNADIYTNGQAGMKGLKKHFGEYEYKTVKTGDTISLGKRTLTFVATPLLHWPDNMLTFCPEEKILFSNDAFGQHLASTERFDDEIDFSVVMQEAKKYFANILMCYESQAAKACDIVKKLDIEIIAPAHGVIYRSHVDKIFEAYEEWSSNDPASGAVVVYDSMWNSTEKMALEITEAFTNQGVTVHLYDLKSNHWSNIVTEILTSRYIAVGSPTLNKQMLPKVAAFLCYLKGLSPRNREAISFGSYGWGGQSIQMIQKELVDCGFDVCTEGIKVNYVPDNNDIEQIHKIIENVVKKVN